jgi:hypothetical protein
MIPAPIFVLVALLFERCDASLYAASMSRTARDKYPGVGAVWSAPNALPMTCEDVANCVEESSINVKPVMAVETMGETAMSPVTAE